VRDGLADRKRQLLTNLGREFKGVWRGGRGGGGGGGSRGQGGGRAGSGGCISCVGWMVGRGVGDGLVDGEGQLLTNLEVQLVGEGVGGG
jgi:hypothetical protein